MTPPQPTLTGPRWPHIVLVGLFALLLVSLAGRTFFAYWEPPFDGTIRFDDVRALGNAYWPMNLYLGGPSYAVSWAIAAIFIALLARGRAGALNLIGALLAGIGGIVFALTITAEVLPFVYAADPSVMPEAEGRALFETLNEHLGLLVPAIIGTQVAIAVGVLLALVGTLISRAVPRWLSIAGIAYIIIFVGLPAEQLGPVVGVIGYLLQVALVAALGWFGLRGTSAWTSRVPSASTISGTGAELRG